MCVCRRYKEGTGRNKERVESEGVGLHVRERVCVVVFWLCVFDSFEMSRL